MEVLLTVVGAGCGMFRQRARPLLERCEELADHVRPLLDWNGYRGGGADPAGELGAAGKRWRSSAGYRREALLGYFPLVGFIEKLPPP